MKPDDLIGQVVTAKRTGWDDDEADEERFLDHTPFSEQGHASPDLRGELSRFEFDLPGGKKGVSWEVGGQPADPKTIRPAA